MRLLCLNSLSWRVLSDTRAIQPPKGGFVTTVFYPEDSLSEAILPALPSKPQSRTSDPKCYQGHWHRIVSHTPKYSMLPLVSLREGFKRRLTPKNERDFSPKNTPRRRFWSSANFENRFGFHLTSHRKMSVPRYKRVLSTFNNRTGLIDMSIILERTDLSWQSKQN